MFDSRYLLRFDDICPTMNWDMWEKIERLLVIHDVRPILAVVPDNRDPKLVVGPSVPDFWDRVRRWQGMGYAIALHGYQHVYVNQERGLTGLTPHSEFTGLPYEEQQAKLQRGVAIFSEQQVRVDAFVAPSHSFDRNTLKALAELGVKVVSDGLWPWPHVGDDGMFWVPLQIWRLEPKVAGLWTACYHHNSWTEKRLEGFERDLARFAPRMTDLAAVERNYAGRPLTSLDRIRAFADLMWNHRIVPTLASVKSLRRLKRRLFRQEPLDGTA